MRLGLGAGWVSNAMPTITLQSIRFSDIPFRKLKALTISIADRITVIAGHNGIGKSTILGLLSNASGFSKKNFSSYFNKAFQANLHDIVHLSRAHDFVDNVEEKPNVYITYDIGGEQLVKRCNTTKRGPNGLRVVPRNDPKEGFSRPGIDIPVDKKVPLPTLYLGMSRMIPVGESAPRDVQQSRDRSIAEEDRNYLHDLAHRLIDTGRDKSEIVTQQAIKHTRKSSKHPQYSDYDSRSVSLGQDSLSSIVTALASFKRLKRQMGAKYPGGLLIIDEIDAGFHPYTQRLLVKILQHEAGTLKLQIIATTHSLPVIEKLLADRAKAKAGAKLLDVVHYLQDTRHPHLCEGWTLDDIRADMYLEADSGKARATKPLVVAYAEDDEAKIIFDRIVCGAVKTRVTKETGAKIKCLSIKMGCADLMKLYLADKYFETVAIVLDADAQTGKVGKRANIVNLPGMIPDGGRPTPELLLYRFCESLVAAHDEHPETWNTLKKYHCSTDYIREKLLSPPVRIDQREEAKRWFIAKFTPINKKWHLLDLWLAENADLRDVFVEQFVQAVKAALRRKIELANGPQVCSS